MYKIPPLKLVKKSSTSHSRKSFFLWKTNKSIILFYYGHFELFFSLISVWVWKISFCLLSSFHYTSTSINLYSTDSLAHKFHFNIFFLLLTLHSSVFFLFFCAIHVADRVWIFYEERQPERYRDIKEDFACKLAREIFQKVSLFFDFFAHEFQQSIWELLKIVVTLKKKNSIGSLQSLRMMEIERSTVELSKVEARKILLFRKKIQRITKIIRSFFFFSSFSAFSTIQLYNENY